MPTHRIAVLSDLHVGSTVGLWPGRHEIEGGGVYEANRYQQWLYECWQHAVAEVQRLRPQVIVLNGDAVQGVNGKDGQIIGATISAQCAAALSLLEPLRKATKRLYVVRGTEWHDGKAADNVESLAQALRAERDPATGQYTRWELYLDVGGPVIHFAHHVGASSVPWYEATVPLRDTLLMLSELWRFFGAKAPNLRMVVRSHRHRYIHVDAPPDIQVVVTPAWQLKTAFSYKRAASMLPEVGWTLIEWDGTDLVVKPRIYTLRGPAVEEVQLAGRSASTIQRG